MHFNVNHTSQCDVKACVVPPSSSHTIQSSVHVHRKCRVGFMFTGSAEQSSCSQEVQSRAHVHKKCRVVFTFTINMEQFSCSQKVLSIQLVFMNRSSALYNSCLQTELLRYVTCNKQQFKLKQYSCSLILCWSETKLSKISEHNCNFFMFQKCIYIGLSSNVCSSI